MPERRLRVALVRHTADPEALVALGARLCYAGGDVDGLLQKVTAEDQRGFLDKLMKMGHESVLEHVSFTFLTEGVSRVLLAQLTRHRIASFSVQSQRYVSYEKGFGYIVPPAIKALGAEAEAEYAAQMQSIQGWYDGWRERLKAAGAQGNEDARFVLPGACETRVLLTMNARELRHFFALRMCSRAQWEIRALAEQMHMECMKVAPSLFGDAGPGCLRGKCPEGEKSCGMQYEKRAEREALLREVNKSRG